MNPYQIQDTSLVGISMFLLCSSTFIHYVYAFVCVKISFRYCRYMKCELTLHITQLRNSAFFTSSLHTNYANEILHSMTEHE